jgi:formate/nitrite transporter FocA (FNT family)
MTDPDDGSLNHRDGETDSAETRREAERVREDAQWMPVIVKRSDEARRHPDDILVMAISEGLEQLCRRGWSLLLSSVGAGLILGFTAMAVAVVTLATDGLESPMVQRIAVALVYPLGFVLCLMSGSELYTEHTATAVYPVLDRQASVPRLLRLWAIVVVGNLLGALASATLLKLADPVVGAADGYVEIGRHLVAYDSVPLLFSAILAGWLMALGAWLILATPPTVSQFASIYVVTFLIGLGGLHHSIAGAVEIFTAVLMSDEFTAAAVSRFLGVALVGNLIGGSLFVAVLNYGHIRHSQTSPGEGDSA